MTLAVARFKCRQGVTGDRIDVSSLPQFDAFPATINVFGATSRALNLSETCSFAFGRLS